MTPQYNTLILGAGASIDASLDANGQPSQYTFPSGEQLREHVSQFLHTKKSMLKSNIWRNQKILGVQGISLIALDTLLSDTEKIYDNYKISFKSVDIIIYYLYKSDHPTHAALIKFIVFLIIFTFDLKYRTMVDSSTGLYDKNWYLKIFRIFNGARFNPLDNKNFFQEMKIKIINFNYDTTFASTIYNTHRAISPKLDPLTYRDDSIIHIYGQVRPYPWEHSPEMETEIQILGKYLKDRSYKEDDEYYQKLSWIYQYYVLEKRELGFIDGVRNPNFDKATEIISASKMIIFLGFGFDEINCQRLMPKKLPLGKRHVLSTRKGMSDENRAMQEREFITKFFEPLSGIEPINQDLIPRKNSISIDKKDRGAREYIENLEKFFYTLF